jgi:TPP-dependent indolepyruvate ferredoxin oxidoreductase alpha subunit
LRGKKAVLVLEKGNPSSSSRRSPPSCAARTCPAKLHGKDSMHMAGDYNVEAAGRRALSKFLRRAHRLYIDLSAGAPALQKRRV